MKSRLVIALVLILCAGPLRAAMTDTAAAAPSESVKIEYRIHETPGDPQSPVVFSIVIGLERQYTSGDASAWHAGTIQFRRKGPAGEADTVWHAYDVDADTPDGLWHVTHANADSPATADFVLPPRFWGTAEGADTTNSDLTFDFRGRVYAPPTGEAPYDITAGMTWDFDTAVGPDMPSGTDQPVELPPIGDGSGIG